jgi:NitT/TauT family transport system permease protein
LIKDKKISFKAFFTTHKKSIYSILALISSLFIWFLIWYIFAKRIGISFILPTPFEAFKEFFLLLPQKNFILAVTGSILRVIIGYIIGISFGVIIAFSGFFVPPIKAFFSPIVSIARATPVSSFILI